jgi:hypothetical protein
MSANVVIVRGDDDDDWGVQITGLDQPIDPTSARRLAMAILVAANAAGSASTVAEYFAKASDQKLADRLKGGIHKRLLADASCVIDEIIVMETGDVRE